MWEIFENQKTLSAPGFPFVFFFAVPSPPCAWIFMTPHRRQQTSFKEFVDPRPFTLFSKESAPGFTAPALVSPGPRHENRPCSSWTPLSVQPTEVSKRTSDVPRRALRIEDLPLPALPQIRLRSDRLSLRNGTRFCPRSLRNVLQRLAVPFDHCVSLRLDFPISGIVAWAQLFPAYMDQFSR